MAFVPYGCSAAAMRKGALRLFPVFATVDPVLFRSDENRDIWLLGAGEQVYTNSLLDCRFHQYRGKRTDLTR